MFWAYLFTRLDVVSENASFVLGASIIAFLFFIIFSIASSGEEDERAQVLMKKGLKYSVWTLAVAASVHCLVPNTKQAAFIWIAPKIVENGEIKETAANIPELAKLGTEYLKEVLKEKIENKGSE